MKKAKRTFKKFKISLPDNIEKRYLKFAYELIKYEGTNITEDIKPDGEKCYMTYDGNIVKVPCESWLNDPISMDFDDWIENYEEEINCSFDTTDMHSCHEWTIELERLKHLPKKTFEEFWSEFLNEHGYREEFRHNLAEKEARLIWEACEKNRGY